MTMDECWALVRATEETGRIYMLSENCCYFRQNMAVMRMVQAGLFGDLTYAECGYVHDCRALKFNADGSLTWRGEMSRDFIGNLYPTHSLGPVCHWLGINRGDRLVSLTASMTPQRGIVQYTTKRFGPDQPATKTKWQNGDSTTALIRTAKDAVIELRYDICSARPHVTTVYYSLQGSTASYEDRNAQQQIWIDGRSKKYAWEPLANYLDEFDHPLWKRDAERAGKTGHGGADYFVISEFIEIVKTGRPVPVDVYDAVAWSAIIPLTAASIRAGGAPQKFPDFTRGTWEKRRRLSA
jgi:predicted dehydrogenase